MLDPFSFAVGLGVGLIAFPVAVFAAVTVYRYVVPPRDPQDTIPLDSRHGG